MKCIYKLCIKDGSLDDCYIGSTMNLKERRRVHRKDCNNENSKLYNTYKYVLIRENGGICNWDFVVLEEFKGDDKIELLKRERYYVELLKPTLNKNIPGRTQKEWEDENKDKRKEYRQNNKEKIKEYYQDNKDKIKERTIEYRQNNKDKLERYKEQNNCLCGGKYTNIHKNIHMKTKRHINYENNIVAPQ